MWSVVTVPLCVLYVPRDRGLYGFNILEMHSNSHKVISLLWLFFYKNKTIVKVHLIRKMWRRKISLVETVNNNLNEIMEEKNRAMEGPLEEEVYFHQQY